MSTKEEEIERFIYDYLLEQKKEGSDNYTDASFAVAYALLQCAAALNRIADSVEEGSRDE
jgi:hypothetical protein